jgi:hypothetical protein
MQHESENRRNCQHQGAWLRHGRQRRQGYAAKKAVVGRGK